MDFLLVGRLATIAGFVLLVGWAISMFVDRIVGAINGVRAAVQSHTNWLQHIRGEDERKAHWAAVAAKNDPPSPANRPKDNENLAPAARELLAGLDRNTIPPRTR